MSSKDSAYSGPRAAYKPSGARSARADHSRQHADHSRRDPESSEKSKRDTDYLQYYQSSLADGRDDTDRESSSSRLTRQTSNGSTSPSDYSDSQSTEFSTTAPLSITSKATRRSKAPSDGGSDRRRLAIVQMDPLDDSPPRKHKNGDEVQSTTIRTRRGVASNLAGLALVAPPDAAPNSYSHLTPPTTAPPAADPNSRTAMREKAHYKTVSNVTKVVNNPGHELTPSEQIKATTLRDTVTEPRVIIDSDVLTPPGDQRKRPSRSPSPGGASERSDHTYGLLSPVSNARPDMTRGDTQNSFITTPEIGEEKEIATRVAAPIIVSLGSAGPFRRKEDNTSRNDSVPQHPISALPLSTQDNSAYLHYEPGVHATAGHLPTLPPPRAMFNIDINSPAPPRPPRLNSPFARTKGDIEAVKQALQLPPSVTAALASRAPRSNTNNYTDSPESKAASPGDPVPEVHATYVLSVRHFKDYHASNIRHVKSVHRREGAFSPSPSTSTTSTSTLDTSSQMAPPSDVVPPLARQHGDVNSSDDTKSLNDHTSRDDDIPPITVIQPMQLIQEDQEDTDVSTDVISSPEQRRTSDGLSARSRSRSPPNLDHSDNTPSPPPKSFRNSLTSNIKRLSSSLPRTPSLSSKSRRSSGTYYSSRTPSPSMHTIPLPPTRPKIISAYPPAMFYADITARKTSHERCSLYAQKINELYMYDTGLSDWTIETKLRGTFDPFVASCLPLTSPIANNNRPTIAFSTHTFTPQPRHTSRSSMISEVTFPRRPDASTATDLTVKTQDLTPTTTPVLPYPSLANQRMYPARSSSIASSLTPPNSIRSLATSTPSSSKASGGGFFASLGRKASMSSSKKPGLPQISTSSGRVLTKNPPATAVPRTINLSNSPVVPGGPRAIPNHRAVRSQTLMATSNSFSSNAPSPDRNEALGRRPSLFDLSSSPEPVLDIVADPEFVRQVDKLVHLLPDADRDVLGGYLRRAGQDILAIGQYLEDEKNGTIKPP
ncbi:hypothetical protein H0H87_011745 [Tephrocybe sp. NHM501043]|nr:hypothetical protein H0H87_011745 [Tephrocybe sp. NHM501043]